MVARDHQQYHTFDSYSRFFQMSVILRLFGQQLFLVMGVISLVNEIQFMLISSRHFSNRSIVLNKLTCLMYLI